MNDWAIRPWLDSSSGRWTPKNEDIIFGRIGIEVGVSNDNFGSVWINCTNTSKGDLGGRIDHGSEDKICGEQNQEGVDGPSDDRREGSGGKGEQQFPEDIFVDAGLWRWSEQGEVWDANKACLVLSSRCICFALLSIRG